MIIPCKPALDSVIAWKSYAQSRRVRLLTGLTFFQIWFKNRRARQKTKNQEETYRLSFLQRGSSSLPHFCCPKPVYCFPMYPVFPSPCQPMMNYHGNTAYGLYNKPTSIFEGRFDDNLYQNRPSVVVPSQERRPNESVACRRELNPYAHHTK